MRAGLVDCLVWIGAPVAIGGDGIPAVAALGVEALAAAPRFEHVATEIVGGYLVVCRGDALGEIVARFPRTEADHRAAVAALPALM